MATDEERRAADLRRQQVFRRRRVAAAAVLVLCVALIWSLLSGGGDGDKHSVGRAPIPNPAAAPPQPSAVDRVLAYTDYIEGGSRRKREVALTFDDGPSPWTPKLLKVLRSQNVPATFFPVGNAINEYAHHLQLVRAGGFSVGDHTMTHPQMGQLTPDKQAGEIDLQAGLLQAAGIPYPRLFRPPYGSLNPDTRLLLHERRMLMVLWSVNPQDYYRPGVKAIVSRVMTTVKPGSIVLMHDGGGDRSQTVAAVPRIVRKLRARGYTLVTVEQMLRDNPPPRGQGPPPNLAGT
jgi:peptidoglycan/xylan/chitin deacetylase (PgdA/CDA1 family)